MTGKQLYEQTLSLLGMTDEDAAELEPRAAGCINQMLSDHLYENNAMLYSRGCHGSAAAAQISDLEEEIPYEEMLVRECFPYGLAAMLIASDDRTMFNWMMNEYERRVEYYAPCVMTDLKGLEE